MVAPDEDNTLSSAAPIVSIGRVRFGNDLPLSIIAGPCALESRAHALEVASALKEIAARLNIGLVYKTSFDKANRTSASAARGIGLKQALPIFAEIRSSLGMPVLTDVHEAAQCAEVAQAVDVLQIPAFLCRQTDLLLAAAATGKVVNVKKGQFLSGPSMKFAVEKIQKAGNNKIVLTERGTTFGYLDLVVDYRNIPWMQEQGAPVVMDCTHSLQQPNQTSGVTGGNPQLIGTIAKAAIATGANGLFIETHPNPAKAKSDGANMLRLDLLQGLLEQLVRIRKVVADL